MATSRALIFSLVLYLVYILNSRARSDQAKLIQLDEGNWGDILEGEWMVEFYAPWCPACKALERTWEELASHSDALGINVGRVDVTNNAGLSGRFMVTALPTIFHVKDGHFRQYSGPRGVEDLVSFVQGKKWMGLEEISAWKSPSSIQMSVVSYFFKLSMILRSIHTQLVEQYNFPFWLSILAFAVATITIGAVLGLLLVCLVDVLFPPKPPTRPKVPKSPPPSTPTTDQPVTPADSEEEGRSNKSDGGEDDQEGSKSTPNSDADSSSPKVNKQVRKRKKNAKKVEQAN